MATPQTPSISIGPGSTIAITGVNGYIGSSIATTFIKAGYHVKGSVRDASRCVWLREYFTKLLVSSDDASDSKSSHHPPRGTFTLVEIPDLADIDAYVPLLTGAASLILTTTTASFTVTDPAALIPMTEAQILAGLEAASRNPVVQSVVLTGSAWATHTPEPDVPKQLSTTSWNEDVMRAAYDEDWASKGNAADEEARAARTMAVFMASKVVQERAAWDWVRRMRPRFRFNVVLASTVFGRVSEPASQGQPSTAGFLAMVVNGSVEEVAKMVRPQWFVDVEDVAVLHLAAAVRADVDAERIFAFSEPYTWNAVLEVLRKAYPEKKFVDDLEGLGRCLVEVPNEKGEQLLREFGREGWTGLEESVKRTVESLKLI
ncbi:uncharacterized protein K452DRAFT_311728 [Aplosporella prunicola CBS 121167]|uniref:NAD-dependent epimerase/dehydratase domain-containing protein n=1 Tax=Aplosporella prunicola CBS 121167 TaxID=1176127 RepID=A0A6A6B2G6_9PEZI|nr:uncharacterized protein K452DRAFT_311728 [Aplosporella prunicola CBS 121167]KAF2138379.1 hypothetical protein K452DRAFT_311728 [Aplosporella prunicola CBS 121167]